MTDYRAQVGDAVRATQLLSTTTFSWFGRRSRGLSRDVKRVLTAKSARDYLLFSLEQQLYADFYCPGFPMARLLESGGPARGSTSFVQQLSAANSGAGSWQEGWSFEAMRGGQIVVKRDGLELSARPRDCALPQEGPPSPGQIIKLQFPKELLAMSPGFYMALGNTDLRGEASAQVVRLYWDLTYPAAVRLVEMATANLNAAALPFRLKVVNDPDRYTRCDAGVLYVHKADYAAVRKIAEEIYAEIAGDLKPGVPAFTKLLAPGLALAEDPGDGGSFGQNRCHLLAEGLVRAHEQERQTLEARLDTVEECFGEHGISLDNPFLNAGSTDVYDFTAPTPKRPAGRKRSEASPEGCLQLAEQIARHLCVQAVWHEGQCNWMGFVSGAGPATFSALGSSLYGGTSGVGLFLAELAAVTEDAQLRATALAAMRQALAHTDGIEPGRRHGLYSGWAGIALAAVRAGTVLGEDELVEEGARLVKALAAEKEPSSDFDLIAGSAGGIVALLAMRGLPGGRDLVAEAVRWGDDLLARADRTSRGLSWRAPAFPHQPNLTGFGHGAAGGARALVELFAATGEPRFRDGARGAFDYERRWFSRAAGNWADLRRLPRRARPGGPLPFMSGWCHGAPGITLSRLRAFAVLGEERYLEEARIAMQTTRRSVETMMASRTPSFGLCHGLAGNCEVLLSGLEGLDEDPTQSRAIVDRVASLGIETWSPDQSGWPWRGDENESPGLMTGLAGIGYFYLRRARPLVPSVLLMRTEIIARGLKVESD